MVEASVKKGEPGSAAKARTIQSIFTRIAPRYDLMNRLMSFGQDVRWRRAVINLAELTPGGRLLDLGAGTGDLAFEALWQAPEARPTAADFTLAMMQKGRRRRPDLALRIQWSAADALRLPFSDQSFEAIVSGFLLRNVTDLQHALVEQRRVLKPGGRLVALDTTRPRRNVLTPLIWLHYHLVIPILGWLVTGQADAYRYLPSSSEGFLRAEELAARLAAAGFHEVGYRRLMFGTIAIHWARRKN